MLCYLSAASLYLFYLQFIIYIYHAVFPPGREKRTTGQTVETRTRNKSQWELENKLSTVRKENVVAVM